MSNILSTRTRPGGLWLAALACLSLPALPAQARGKATKIAYIPGITLTPEVLLADGTPRSYNTTQGPTLWRADLPVQQGDQMKLNVFVATGGADLSELRVKLDNNPLSDIKATPWTTTIDTAPLTPGYHMIEVWAQATGDPPQSSTKSLSFYVVKALPAEYAVKGIQQELTGGTTRVVTPDPNAVPPLPVFLAGQSVDDAARVSLAYKSASAPATDPSVSAGGDAITVSEPTLFSVTRPRGSAARQFAYCIVRDGTTIVSSSAIRLDNPNLRTLIKIQGRTDVTPGLRPGAVTLWVWGVDAAGHPGTPAKAQLQVP